MQIFTPPSLPQGFPSLNPGPRLPNKGPHLPSTAQVDEIGGLLPTYLGTSTTSFVEFPSISFSEKGSHSLVPHMYPNLDNARVENTGFNPREWTVIGILTNNIYPSKTEGWAVGSLYPFVWNQLKAQLESKASQILNHPEVGQVNVKVKSYDYILQSDKPRDGVIVTMVFTECINDQITLQQTNAATSSPLSELDNTANALDNAIAAPFNDPRLAPPGVSLQGLFTQIAGFIRNVTNFPSMAAVSLNAQVLGLTSTIGGAAGNLLNTPANIYGTIAGIISLNKRTQFGFAPVFNAVQNDQQLGPGQITRVPTSPNNPVQNSTPQPTGNASRIQQTYQRPVVYPFNETGALIQAYFTLTTTANKGAPAIINKSLIFSQRLHDYYAAMQSYQTAQIQQLLLKFANQLIQLQNPVNSNPRLASFVNSVPFTWMDAANQSGNNIDTIMQLNLSLSKLIIIPANSTIFYNNG